MKKTLDELKLEMTINAQDTSLRILSIQEQYACKGQGNPTHKSPPENDKLSSRAINLSFDILKYTPKFSK